MQLFARDEFDRFVGASQADRGKNYFCFECKGAVRVRGGIQRQKHFFHLKPSQACRASGKTLEHIQTQRYIQRVLPKDAAVLEKPFPTINRIADVVWEERKIVYEVQCSPIKAEELLQRNSDYGSLGYQVVWILHERNFAGPRLCEAELALLKSPHYFTDMNSAGEGQVYDRCFAVKDRQRFWHPLKREVDLASPLFRPFLPPAGPLPTLLLQRWRDWGLGFEGDCLFQKVGAEQFLALLSVWERRVLGSPVKRVLGSGIRWLQPWVNTLFLRPYRTLFRASLEKHCR